MIITRKVSLLKRRPTAKPQTTVKAGSVKLGAVKPITTIKVPRTRVKRYVPLQGIGNLAAMPKAEFTRKSRRMAKAVKGKSEKAITQTHDRMKTVQRHMIVTRSDGKTDRCTYNKYSKMVRKAVKVKTKASPVKRHKPQTDR